MKQTLLTAALALCAGCMNLYVRNPLTDVRIDEVYKSTRTVGLLSYAIAFPQIMNPAGDGGWMLANLLTIPVGCVCLCDAACEAAIDTVCLPYDWPVSAKREADWEEWCRKRAEDAEREYEKETR